MNKNNEFYELPCRHCDNGEVEIGPICFKVASECCGGCYEVQTCSICNGNGVIVLEDEYQVRAFKLLCRLMHTGNRIPLQNKLETLIYDNYEYAIDNNY